MTFYAITDEDEKLGFTPVDYISKTPKKRISHLFPEDTNNYLNYGLKLKTEKEFAGIDEISLNPISNNIKLQNLEKRIIVFE